MAGRSPLVTAHLVGTVQLLQEREEMLLQWGGDEF